MSDDEVRVPAGLATGGLLGVRCMARFIDSVFIILAIGGVLGLVEAILKKPAAGGLAGVLFVLFNLSLVMVVWIGYFTAFESSPWQATLGKRFIGLRVYNSQAGRPTPLQAAGRTLVKDGPFLVFAFIPGGRLLALIWLGAHLVVLHRSPVPARAIGSAVTHRLNDNSMTLQRQSCGYHIGQLPHWTTTLDLTAGLPSAIIQVQS